MNLEQTDLFPFVSKSEKTKSDFTGEGNSVMSVSKKHPEKVQKERVHKAGHSCCHTPDEAEIVHEALLTQEYAMSEKTKDRAETEYKDLVHRLNRIEGQIRGIRGMVDKDAYCIDILTQVAATRCALNSFTKVLLSNHIKTCVTNDIRSGHDETVDELVEALQKLMK